MAAQIRPLAYHTTMRLEDDRVIVRSPIDYRTIARVVHRQGEARGLLAFRAADTQIHALLEADRATCGDFARYATSALHQRLGLPVKFEPARFRPVIDQRHLTHAFRYILRQEERHGVTLDPVHDGSMLPDLLGFRLLGCGAVERVAWRLPRIQRDELAALLGRVDLDAVEPRIDLLADAAAAAIGHPHLQGHQAAPTAARHAAVQAGRAVGFAPTEIATALGISLRTVERAQRATLEPRLLRAVLLQLRLRTAVKAEG